MAVMTRYPRSKRSWSKTATDRAGSDGPARHHDADPDHGNRHAAHGPRSTGRRRGPSAAARMERAPIRRARSRRRPGWSAAMNDAEETAMSGHHETTSPSARMRGMSHYARQRRRRRGDQPPQGGASRDLSRRVDRELALEETGRRPGNGGERDERVPSAVRSP